MFTYIENYEFEWPVTVKYPGADDHEAVFTARFVMVDEDELFRSPSSEGPVVEMIEADRVKWAGRWVGWQGIKTPDGNDLPFTAENREKLLRQRPIREAILRAYSDAVIYGGVAEKN